MASITISARAESHPNLRALNILRDLPQIADLIELCFSNTMDGEGQRYVQDMRRAGRDDTFLKWAIRTADSTSLPLSGYVWEENGRIVGNASLVPFRYKKQRIYLIANVAVHPDFRRRGIARALAERAMLHAREKKADAIWLHVRDDNPDAIQLYTDLGFVERARRTNWQSAGDAHAPQLQTDITVTTRDARWWPTQHEWLTRLYPDLLAWHRNWSFNALQPGLWNWLYLLFVDMNIRQWAAVKEDPSTALRPAQDGSSGRLEAALAWVPSRQGESFYLAAGPGSDPDAVTALLLNARRALSHHLRLSLEFPSTEFDRAIRAAGFKSIRTLIWMEAGGATL
jgi:ribosomal protein S18 acetylase RimI-like enzyme